MKLEKLPSGSYRVRKMYKGVQYTVIFSEKPSQKEMLQAIAAELDKAQEKKTRMTFKTAAEEYIISKDNVISPSTKKGYASIIKSIRPLFKEKIITDITSLDVQKEINAYSKNHSAKTVRNMHGFISAVMSMFAPNTILNTTLPQYIKKEPYIPTDSEVKAILNEAKNTPYEIPLQLAVLGLRRSEICALTLADIFDDHIRVDKAKVMDQKGNWVIKTTKTASSTRDVVAPSGIIDLIRDRGYIFNGHPNNILIYLNRTQDKLGIPRFSLHKLRHYYASTLHSLNFPDAYVMRAGGWKTDNVLKSVYRHALNDKQSEMEKKAVEHFSNLIS